MARENAVLMMHYMTPEVYYLETETLSIDLKDRTEVESYRCLQT